MIILLLWLWIKSFAEAQAELAKVCDQSYV